MDETNNVENDNTTDQTDNDISKDLTFEQQTLQSKQVEQQINELTN